MSHFVDFLDVQGYLALRWSHALPEPNRPPCLTQAQQRELQRSERLFQQELARSGRQANRLKWSDKP